ncbi:MAG: hypothetical protein JWR44_1595, partial [Hymenobacter sp.]|nr:hypothetical protein [Hymenobacter sp.]
RALAREQRGLRQRGRALLGRFIRHHRKRREDMLRRRFRLQLAMERHLHRAELRLCQLTNRHEQAQSAPPRTGRPATS